MCTLGLCIVNVNKSRNSNDLQLSSPSGNVNVCLYEFELLVSNIDENVRSYHDQHWQIQNAHVSCFDFLVLSVGSLTEN